MAETQGDGDPAESGITAETATDRRRPGRMEDASPSLVPLLRNPIAIEIPPDERPGTDYVRDELGAAKGIAVGLLLVVPFWCLVALVVWWVIG